MSDTIKWLFVAAIALTGCEAGTAREGPVQAERVVPTAQAAMPVPAGARLAPELVGRTARVELADGRTILVRYNADGTAIMTGPAGLNLTGRWFVASEELCFDWPGQPRECWPYPAPAQPGQTVTSRSDRGQVIRTTLLRRSRD